MGGDADAQMEILLGGEGGGEEVMIGAEQKGEEAVKRKGRGTSYFHPPRVLFPFLSPFYPLLHHLLFPSSSSYSIPDKDS